MSLFSSFAISAYSFVHQQTTLIIYLKNLAGQLLASSALWSLVAATPRAHESLIKPKVFLIDMVSFQQPKCVQSAHIRSKSSHQKVQSGTGSQNSTCSPKTSPCLASPPSFQTRIALPMAMFVRSSPESRVGTQRWQRAPCPSLILRIFRN